MPIYYKSKSIIPAPRRVSINKVIERNPNGSVNRSYFSIEANGVMLAGKGSPLWDGTWHTGTGYPDDTPSNIYDDPDKRLAIFAQKKKALCQLFCDEGYFFEIQSYDGSSPVKFIPTVAAVSFNENEQDGWFEKIEYTISMQADKIWFGGGDDTVTCCSADDGDNFNNQEVTESWSVEPLDNNRTWRLTHNVSAVGRDKYADAGDGTREQWGWEVARTKVYAHLGIAYTDPTTEVQTTNTSDVKDYMFLLPTGFTHKKNYIRNESRDTYAGSFTVTENWILADSSNDYIEDYSVSIRTSESGNITVSIEGSVTGYETRNETTFNVTGNSKYINAKNGWDTISSLLKSRAQTLSGVTLNPNIVNSTVGRNEFSGVITYSYEFDNRKTPSIPGVIRETINVQDNFPVPIVAKHVCLLRANGPIFQPIGTSTSKSRTLTIELQVRADTNIYNAIEPNVLFIVASYVPSGVVEGPYVTQNSAQWSPTTGRYSRNVTWEWN